VEEDDMRGTWRKSLALSLLLTVGEAFPPGGITTGFAKTESDGRIEPGLKVIARVYNYARVEPATLALAENEAQRIYQHAGVTIVWRDIPLSAVKQGAVQASRPDEPAYSFPDVFLRIVPSSMSPIDRHETLGCALPSSKGRPASDAWVLFDRIEQVARHGIASPYQILGHAMAHEIGHLLLGQDAHAVAGVMRADWRTQDYILMSQASLLFTPRQAELIRLAVQARIRQQNNAVSARQFGNP
jgi:hypothetical protein